MRTQCTWACAAPGTRPQRICGWGRARAGADGDKPGECEAKRVCSGARTARPARAERLNSSMAHLRSVDGGEPDVTSARLRSRRGLSAGQRDANAARSLPGYSDNCPWGSVSAWDAPRGGPRGARILGAGQHQGKKKSPRLNSKCASRTTGVEGERVIFAPHEIKGGHNIMAPSRAAAGCFASARSARHNSCPDLVRCANTPHVPNAEQHCHSLWSLSVLGVLPRMRNLGGEIPMPQQLDP